MKQINVPNLKVIGGSFNAIGNKSLSEKDFPSLKTVGGDMHLVMSGFKRLPNNLNSIKGNIYLSPESPESLKKDCLHKKETGIIKGEIYFVGGSINKNEKGEVVYGEIMPIQ